MQFSNVFTLLTIVMTAAAAPAEVVARTTITPESCTIPDYQPYCCQSLPILSVGSLSCVLGVIGGQCGASVKCCKSDVTNTGNSLIIINAANCVA